MSAADIRAREQELAVDLWNRDHRPETGVRFWPGLRSDNEPSKIGQTTGEAFLMGSHTAVVRVAEDRTGRQDLIALSHVRPLEVDERLVIDVTEEVEVQLTIDTRSPRYSWLRDHPREDWERLLTESANETEGYVDSDMRSGDVISAGRNVQIVEAG